MTESRDHFASDQSTTKVVFRGDLVCTPSGDEHRPHVVVEDPIAGNYFRLGKVEYALASLLGADRSIAEAFRVLCQRIPDHHLTEDDAIELCRWLIGNELAHTDSSKSAVRMQQASQKHGSDKLKQRMNPVAIRIPLLRPDRPVQAITRSFGWLFSPIGTMVGSAIILFAAALAIRNWSKLAESSEYLFSGTSLATLILVTCGLKIVHEFAHAVCCKRYGGDVGEMGILLILLAPLAYVDVSSVWKFRSKWQRVHVAMAGIYIELLLASFAMFVWSLSDSAWIQNLCASVMLSASAITLLFNANPLMKFDGYFALTDMARTPNLYSDSQRFLIRKTRQLFLGGRSREPDWTPAYRRLVALYGIMAFGWKCVVCVGLTVAATKMFHGLGMLLAIAACVTWIGFPMVRACKTIVTANHSQRRRTTIIGGILMSASVILLLWVPWPGCGAVHAVVEYSPHDVVRSEVEGFVDVILVNSGQVVVAGQELLQLRNQDLEQAAISLNSQIEQATIRQRQQTLAGQRAAAQAEDSKIRSLRKQLAELQLQLDALTVRAPRDGTVIRRRLDELSGTYLAQGDEILVVGNEDHKELRLLIPQSEFERFRDSVGAPVRFQVPHSAIHSSQLDRIIPRAKSQIDYPALTAIGGGPLPVKTASGGDDDQQTDVELIVPHFEAVVPIDASVAGEFYAGQKATLSIGGFDETIGERMWRIFAAHCGSW